MAEMNDIKIPIDLDPSLMAGYHLSHPEPGEEVVISGLSGTFPESSNIHEFQENLFNKVDMMTENASRWTCDHPEVPKFTGKLPNVKDFDASFFGLHYKQAMVMDPAGRIILEKVYEAIIDAGLNINELRGSKTAIILSISVFEGHIKWYYITPTPLALTCADRSTFAHRIGYMLGTRGPAYMVDTACSSSHYGLNQGFRAIRMENCDNAIIIGCNTLFHPIISLQFNRLGVLNKDGKSKSFDATADGYTRSEAVCAVVLQRAKHARRCYAEIIHSKANCDGYKEEGITFPSRHLQQILLSEFYKECCVNPLDINYVEAHGTGTKVGDPEEITAISNIYLEGRKDPLLFGSVKSNIGHSEPAAGLCSITKVIIAMETGYIPPNMHFNKPREEVKELLTKRMLVVTEKTKLVGDLIAVNCFGFGGANCHVLLKKNTKEKINHGIPKDDLPRLVCISGRTKEAVDYIINDLGSRPLDAEFVRLLQEIFKYNIDGHYVRSYAIMTKKQMVTMKVSEYEGEELPIWYIFSGLGSQWAGMGASLMKIKIFASTIEKCHKILSTKGINLTKVITSKDPKIFEDNIHITVGITAIQLALIDLLMEIKVSPVFMIGYSIGEIACAYADKCLTLEQAIMCSYLIGQASREMKTEADLLKNLIKLIPKPQKRSSKWLTTMDNKRLSETCSAEYLVHSLSCAFVMKEKIPKNTIIVEIAPHGHLQGLLKEAFGEDLNTLALVKKDYQDPVEVLMTTIGELYLKGCNPRVEFLFPDIKFPVSRTTPMISPLIKWNYKYDWYVPLDIINASETGKCTYNATISLTDSNKYLNGHVIDGRVLYPATGYLNLAWGGFDKLNLHLSKTCAVFKNIQLLRATNMPASVIVRMQVIIQTSGNFEIIESDQPIAKGNISSGSEKLGNEEMTDLPALIVPKYEQYKMLSEKDIYKELRLRGYYYSGLFRGIRSCDITGTIGELAWNNNYVAFMDTMLQMAIISEDTRSLFIPVGIDKIIINYKKHQEIIENLKDDETIPVYYYKHLNIIKSGGIEIQGVKVNAISRRKPLSEPVLETYKYIPNTTNVIHEESIRIIIQVIIENLQKIKVRTIEYIDKEIGDRPLLSPLIQVVLGDFPLIQADVNIISNKTFKDLNGIQILDKKLDSDNSCFLVTLINGIADKELIQKAQKSLIQDGFILSRENLDYDPSKMELDGYEVILEHIVENEKIILIRKSSERILKTMVDVTNGMKHLDWLPILQNSIKNDVNTVVYAEGDELSGVLGLVNCIRKEPGNELVSCVYVMDKDAPKFSLDSEFYKKQLKKGLAINVLKNGVWGTYRHLLLKQQEQIQVEHAYVNVMNRGDLSSLRWIEGYLSTDTPDDFNNPLVHVYYAALNFRDIMTSTGRLAAVYVAKDRIEQECVQGLEYAGRLSNGKRVVGVLMNRAMSSLVQSNPIFTWEFPDSWSFEEAVTTPVVYCTLFYGFILSAKIRKGQTILIHAGSGGIGQAAINLALYYGLKVYTTVGTPEKREFIKSTWPEIKDNQIGNSRDVSFEHLIMTETKGRGVDIVLNSLSEDKLLASVRCLARNGKFIEIGKFDLSVDNPINLEFIKRDASYHGVMLDLLYNTKNQKAPKLSKLVTEGYINGSIKPLTRKVFKRDEVEEAFRFMGAGKHIGKVLIKVRDEENEKVVVPKKMLFNAVPKYVPSTSGVYIITGGLGGFGLELTDWLILRGARNIVLVSRKGVTTGYQSYRINIWRGYGVVIHVSTADITTFNGCRNLIEESREFGPIEGVFNLAVVLKDSLLENQTTETYEVSFGPKAVATQNLDVITRKMCPDLKSFVVFSSVSCGRGNAGQTNYGMANSIMERICEQRKLEGYPALAIEWGAVGEVGLVADMQDNALELEIGGTLQQKISSCLSLLDQFLKQTDPIVASMVVAEKKSYGGAGGNAIDAIANILGIRDLKTISTHSNLAELGMDSIMAVEIKQTLEREFEIFLTAQDIRTLTLAKLLELGNTNKVEVTEVLEEATILEGGLNFVLRTFEQENANNISLVLLPSLAKPECKNKCVMIPGIEGMSMIMEPLAKNMDCQVICSQPSLRILETEIEKISSIVYNETLSQFESNDRFVLVGYSFGSIIALEIASILESRGKIGQIVLIDGSHEMLREVIKLQIHHEDENELQNYVLMKIISLFVKTDNTLELKSIFESCPSWEAKLQVLLKNKPEDIKVTPEYLMSGCEAIYSRLKAVLKYQPKFNKIKSFIKLIKPEQPTSQYSVEDFGLSVLAENPIEIVTVPGNHITMLNHKECAEEINVIFKKK